MPTHKVADSLRAETERLRGLGLLPERDAERLPAPVPVRSPDDLGEPACSHCRGLGWVRPEGPGTISGKQADFPALVPCVCARDRLAAAATARLQRAAGLDAVDLDLGWGVLYQTPGTDDGKRAVRATLERGWGWVYLWGPPGPGKTVILKAAVAETLRAGRGAVFVTWPDLLNHLRAGFGAGDYQARLDAWRAAPVLAVDEMFRANDTKFVDEAQALIFNHRHESALRQQTVTLFASNFAPDDSVRVDDWFYDRLRDGRHAIAHVGGPSLRPVQRSLDHLRS